MTYDTIIIGAGLSGLVAARELQQAGFKVLVLDKGRSVGGRLATRRLGQGLADHGAQFFTARTPDFQEQVDRWLSEDKIKIWGYGWSDGSLKRTTSDGHPRYIVPQGMNQLARYFEAELNDVDIFVETFVRSIKFIEDSWCVTTGDQCAYTGRSIILTPPVPQSLELVKMVDIGEIRKELERINYGPCLAGLFTIDGGINLPEPGAIQRWGETMYWIADNQRKGISPEECTVTVHAEARWSRQNYETDDAIVLGQMAESLQSFLEPDAVIRASELKKWRYSVPLTTYPQDYLFIDRLMLAFAGDAFGGRGRMEGAYMSGLSVGRALVEKVKPKIK